MGIKGEGVKRAAQILVAIVIVLLSAGCSEKDGSMNNNTGTVVAETAKDKNRSDSI